MKPATIKRKFLNQEIEIELTLEEMWKIRHQTELMNCMEWIQDLYIEKIPEEELMQYANDMRDLMVYDDLHYEKAREIVVEQYGLDDLYEF